jgi:hypothetical protein
MTPRGDAAARGDPHVCNGRRLGRSWSRRQRELLEAKQVDALDHDGGGFDSIDIDRTNPF